MATRRHFLLSAFASLVTARGGAARAGGESEDPERRDLQIVDATEGGRRFVLVTPREATDGPLPLVVLLHGLGETTNERLGAWAWIERYGLLGAWQRMKHAPVARTSKRGDWTDARLAEVNAELAARPFRGFAMVCPFMPNPKGPADLDAYAKWLERSLLPRCRSSASLVTDAAHTHLCGVSLGGYVSLEMLLRLPTVFGAWAGVQTAIGAWAATSYAERIARTGPRPTLLLTSTLDSFRSSSEALAAALRAKKLDPTLRIVPGPHDQPWLREAGSIEALHFLDRVRAPGSADKTDAL